MLNTPWMSISYDGRRPYPSPRILPTTRPFQVHRQAPSISLEPRIQKSSIQESEFDGGINFEAVGATIGGAVAFGLYLPTLPIIWIDGPIPVADVAWYLGLGWTVTKGAGTGAKAGRALDEFEESFY